MNAICINRPTVRCAYGRDYTALWAALAIESSIVGDQDQDIAAEDPSMQELGMDRRSARSTDKQARLLLAAAIACIGDMEEQERANCGLYLGVPTVDEPMPQLAAVADWHEQRGRSPLAEHFKCHSAPLGWLAMLNSSAAAHISMRLSLRGCNGVYSPFADAGLNALIDAAIAVADGESAFALVGAVAPKHDPLLVIQYIHWRAPEYRLPSVEVSACALISRAKNRGDTTLRGFARGFAPMPWDNDQTVVTIAMQALAMAGLQPEQIGWMLTTAAWNLSQDVGLRSAMRHLARSSAVLSVEHVFGCMGPAAPMVALGLGLHGIELGQAWDVDSDSRLHLRTLAHSNVLIVTVSPLGQCVAVIIGCDE